MQILQTRFVVVLSSSRISDKTFRIKYRTFSFNNFVNMMSVQKIIVQQIFENNVEQRDAIEFRDVFSSLISDWLEIY